MPIEGAAPTNVFSLDAVKSSFTETKERVKETLGVFKERGVLRRREYAGVAPQVHGAPKNAEVRQYSVSQEKSFGVLPIS